MESGCGSAGDSGIRRFGLLTSTSAASLIFMVSFAPSSTVKVEYDRTACAGWYQCVQEWDVFEMNIANGKADLDGSTETDDGVFVLEVPNEAEDAAKAAAETCPVDAIEVYDADGDRLIP